MTRRLQKFVMSLVLVAQLFDCQNAVTPARLGIEQGGQPAPRKRQGAGGALCHGRRPHMTWTCHLR